MFRYCWIVYSCLFIYPVLANSAHFEKVLADKKTSQELRDEITKLLPKVTMYMGRGAGADCTWGREPGIVKY